MLKQNGIPVVELDALLAKRTRDKCLVSCDCSRYQMRAWCKHICAVAIDRGIVTGYPPLMDPKPLVPTPRRGRPLGRTPPLTID